MMEKKYIDSQLAALATTTAALPGIVVVHNLRTLAVEYMSEQGLRLLHTTLPVLRMLGADFYSRYFTSTDARDYTQLLRKLATRSGSDEPICFLHHWRAAPPQPEAWYLSTVHVWLRDATGQPLFALAFAVCLNSLTRFNSKVARLLEEDAFLQQHQALFRQLTPREKHVLRLLALGHNSRTIAQELTISMHTVLTHRRNIKAKLKPETNHDLSLYAYAFDLV